MEEKTSTRALWVIGAVATAAAIAGGTALALSYSDKKAAASTPSKMNPPAPTPMTPPAPQPMRQGSWVAVTTLSQGKLYRLSLPSQGTQAEKAALQAWMDTVAPGIDTVAQPTTRFWDSGTVPTDWPADDRDASRQRVEFQAPITTSVPIPSFAHLYEWVWTVA